MVKKFATGQHYFMVGNVFHKRHATKNARQVHFLSYRHWCGLFTIGQNINLPLMFIFRRMFQFAEKDYGLAQNKNEDGKAMGKAMGKGTGKAMGKEMMDEDMGMGNHKANPKKLNLYSQMKNMLRRETNFTAKRIMLVSQGKVMFYVFNPVSFWFAFDDKNTLRVIVAEVHNTYGEHHYYLLYKKNTAPINNNDIFTAQKEFHVSPFYDRQGFYRFQFFMDDKKFSANIKLLSSNGTLQLDTGMTMKKLPMNNKNALRLLIAMPFQPWKVILTIHLHAFYLFLKKLSFRKRPEQFKTKITHGVYDGGYGGENPSTPRPKKINNK